MYWVELQNPKSDTSKRAANPSERIDSSTPAGEDATR